MKKSVLFLDNEFIPVDNQLVEKLTPGILKGRGVFETLRVYPGAQIFGLPEHLSRLKYGLKTLNMQSPLSPRQMKDVLENILSLNYLTSAQVRLIVWQDPHRRQTHAAVMAFSYEPFLESQYRKGFKAAISSIRSKKCFALPRIKSIDYTAFLRMYRQARSRGCDEGLLLNDRGELVEGSRSNIFFLTKSTLCTPALTSGCLKGITRGFVIRIAREIGLKVAPVRASVEDLLNADEAFLTNSLIEVMPLTAIDGKLVGNGKAEHKTLKILRKYRRLVSGSWKKYVTPK